MTKARDKPTELQRWLRDQRDQDMRGIYIETAALAGNMAAYVRGRLRYGLLNSMLAAAIYLLEFIALRRTYVSRHLVTAFAVHTGCVLAVAFWWGALDMMRVEIRKQRMERGWGALAIAIETWWSAAVILAAGLAALSVIAFGVVALRAPQWRMVALYGGACGIRLGISLVIRTYHSCVYSLRRVRRPIWSMRVADSVGLVVLLATTTSHAHGSLQAMRVIVAAVLSGLVSAFFVRRTWQRLELPAPRISWRRPLRALANTTAASVRTFVVAGLGGAVLQGANVLALFTVVLFLSAGGFYQRSTMLYVVSPFVAVAASWPNVLYFDCFRLAMRIADLGVRQRLIAHMRMLAPIFGVIGGGLAIGVVYIVHYESSGAPLLFIIPLAAACSAFTVEQLADFSCGRHLASVLRIVPLAVVPLFVLAIRRFLPAWSSDHVALAMVIFAVALGAWPRSHEGIKRPLTTDKPVPLASWLAELGAASAERAIPALGMAGMARSPVSPNAQTAAEELASRLGARGCVVTLVSGRVLWFAPPGAPALTPAEVAIMSGGMASKIEITRELALADAVAQVRKWVVPASAALVAPSRELSEVFREICPDGHVLEIDSNGDRTPLTTPEQCAIYRAAADVVSGRRPRVRARELDVAPFAPEGSVRTIYVLPKTVPREKRSGFSAFLLDHTLRRVEAVLRPRAK